MRDEDTWTRWMHGATITEIAAARGSTRHAVAVKIAHVIVTEYGGWDLVRAEQRLRQWAAQVSYEVRGHLRRGHDEWIILRACNLTREVYRALRAYLSGTWTRTRGPAIRGRALAKLEACYRAHVPCARAARICEVSRRGAESVYRRLDAGKALNSGYTYVYHNDGTGLEEMPCAENE